MSTTVHLAINSDESTERALLLTAVEACEESLAIIESGHIVYANRSFARMFGYGRASEVQGRELAEFVPQDCFSTRLISDHENPGCSAAHGHPTFEFGSVRRDGTSAHVEASYAGFRFGDRNLLVIGTRDISQRKQAEQQLRLSQKTEAVGRLVAGVAHDFNNLLTGILLYCDLLLADSNQDHRSRHQVEEIRNASRHGSALIRQLLAAARQQVVESHVLSWNEIVRGMQNLLTRLIPENIELVTELAADLGYVEMDPSQVQQIILNLVLNARDAMPDGGRLTLKTRNRTDGLRNPGDGQPCLIAWVQFTVTDTGSGMDAETRSHLFEPFFTTKKSGQGNGLGLVTVSRIVQELGGKIDLKSEPGKGTQVVLCLPRVCERTGRERRGEAV